MEIATPLNKESGIETRRAQLFPKIGSFIRGHNRYWLWLADIIWFGFVLFGLGIFVMTLPARYLNLRDEVRLISGALEQLKLDPGFVPGLIMAFEALTLAVYLLVGLLIFWLKRMGWASYFSSLTLVLAGTALVRPMDTLFFADPRLRVPLLMLFAFGTATIYILLFTFPDGHVVPHWTIWLLLVSVAYVVGTYLEPVLVEHPLRWPPAPISPTIFVPIVAGAVIQVYRYRRRSTELQREQTKWILLGLLAAATGLVCFRWMVPTVWPGVLEPGMERLIYVVVGIPLVYVCLMLFPLAISISILFHRLWDINLLISRTLLYISLTAILAGLYIASITVFQRLFMALTAQQSGPAEIVTTFIVVVAFSPLKDQLQKVIDRRWKETSDYQERFKLLAAQIDSRISPVEWEQLTERLLKEAVLGFCARGGAIYRAENGGLRLVHRRGKWDGKAELTVNLISGTENPLFGQLALGPRVDGKDYGERDRQALMLIGLAVMQAIEEDWDR